MQSLIVGSMFATGGQVPKVSSETIEVNCKYAMTLASFDSASNFSLSLISGGSIIEGDLNNINSSSSSFIITPYIRTTWLGGGISGRYWCIKIINTDLTVDPVVIQFDTDQNGNFTIPIKLKISKTYDNMTIYQNIRLFN